VVELKDDWVGLAAIYAAACFKIRPYSKPILFHIAAHVDSSAFIVFASMLAIMQFTILSLTGLAVGVWFLTIDLPPRKFRLAFSCLQRGQRFSPSSGSRFN
jgi:hypothetical protein